MSDPSYAPKPWPTQAPATPGAAQSPTPPSDMLSNILAGGYSGINNFAFGLPDLAVKAFGGQNYQNLKNWQAANPVGSTIGGLAGDVGSFFIPGGVIAKAAGKGAQALGATKAAESLANLSRVAKGGEGIGKFATGAAQAAEQAIPRALTATATNPEDAGNNALGAGAGILGGGVLGSALGKLGKVAGNLKQDFGHQMTDQYLLGIGVPKGSIARHLAEQGGGAGHVEKELEPAKLNLAQYAHANGIKDDRTLKEYLIKANEELKPVAEKWNAEPPSGEDIKRRFLSDPANADMAIPPEALDQAVHDISNPDAPGKMGDYFRVNNALDANYGYAVKHLDASAAGGIQAQKDAESVVRMYAGLRKAVRDEAFDRAPEAAKELRENWFNHLALRDASIANSEQMLGASTGTNAGGLSGLSNPALARSILSAGGAGAGAALTPDNRVLGGAAGAAAGAALPNFLPRAISSIATKIAGHALPSGVGAPISGDVTGATGKLSQLLGNIGAGAPKAAGAIPTQIGQNQPPQQPPTPTSGQVPGLPLGVHNSMAPVSLGGEPVQIHGNVNLPGGIEGGAGQRVMDNLTRIYNLYHPTDNGVPLSKQAFMDQVMQMTNGLDPTNQMTVNVLSNNTAERQELSSSLPRLKNLTNPGSIDLNKLVSIPSNLAPWDIAAQRTNNNFVTMLAELNNKDPNKQPSEKDIALAQDTVNKIRNDYTLSDAQKKAQILNLLVQRGFPLAKLKALGLTAGTQLEGF